MSEVKSTVTILGIPIQSVTLKAVYEQCRAWLGGSGQHVIVTANPEILMAAQKQHEFFELLQKTYNIPDGSGLQFAARHVGGHLPARVTGVDLTEYLLRHLAGESESVFLLGAGTDVAWTVAQRFSKLNPKIVIAGVESGIRDWQHMPDHALVERINRARPRVLLVAFGAPKQELWLAKHLDKMPSVKIAIGVGGSFDFLSGRVRRAPRLMRAIRLEWLWRLWLQPWRWPRIVVATWHFSRAVVRYRSKPMHS